MLMMIDIDQGDLRGLLCRGRGMGPYIDIAQVGFKGSPRRWSFLLCYYEMYDVNLK